MITFLIFIRTNEVRYTFSEAVKQYPDIFLRERISGNRWMLPSSEQLTYAIQVTYT
jgi:hypothetical protein